MSPSIHQNLLRPWSRWNGWLEFSGGLSVQEWPRFLLRSRECPGRELRCWISLLAAAPCSEPTVGKASHPNPCPHTQCPRAQPGGCSAPALLGTAQTPLLPCPWGTVLWAPGLLSAGKGNRDSLASTWALLEIPPLVKHSKTPKWPHAQHLPTSGFGAQNKETLSLPGSHLPFL